MSQFFCFRSVVLSIYCPVTCQYLRPTLSICMEDSLQNDRNNSLVVLPSPPSELHSLNPFVKCYFGHYRTIRTLLHLKLPGLLIRKQPQILGSQPVSDESGQGCLFIPAPSFNKLLLIIYASSFFDENYIDEVKKSIGRQLKLINQGCFQQSPSL